MEIGVIYSGKDPNQLITRDFVRKFVKERGILAKIIEKEKPVQVPEIIIDGCRINKTTDKNSIKERKSLIPLTIQDIAKALEKTIWSL